MLYMILSQGRRGMAASTRPRLSSRRPSRPAVVNGKSFQYFVDAWGNPLRFFMFPTGNDEINVEPYIRTTTPGSATPYTTGRDVQDPEDSLMSAVWNPAFRNDFRAKIHDLPTPPGVGVPARHLMPIVASPGKDGSVGHRPGRRWRPRPDRTTANDNIYSYRLRRFGNRGD